MKLYKIPRGSLIKAQCSNKDGILGEFITFHHIDGMYSYCTVYGTKMEYVVHLSASTELVRVADYYIIKEIKDEIHNRGVDTEVEPVSK